MYQCIQSEKEYQLEKDKDLAQRKVQENEITIARKEEENRKLRERCELEIERVEEYRLGSQYSSLVGQVQGTLGCNLQLLEELGQ